LRRVTPKIRPFYLFFKFGKFEFLRLEVKDAPVTDELSPGRTLSGLQGLACFLQGYDAPAAVLGGVNERHRRTAL
jgi:hypothetical protein